MIPYTHSQRAFASAAATETKGLDMEFSRCPLKVVEIITTGFSGTLDIQGRVGATGTFDNVSYSQLGQDGAQAVANDQLSYTTSTARARYLVSEPWPYLQLVMSRSAGSITINTYGWAVALSPTAVIKLGANSGVDIGDVDVLSIAAGANNIGGVTDAGPASAGTETYTTSADMTTAAAIGPAPSSGQKSKLLEISISVDTAMLFSLQEETSATVRHAFRLPANGTVVRVFRHPSKLATADKKWMGKASVAGNVYITTTTVSEA